MPRTITEIDVLRQYLSGVLDRAGHHALNVGDIALAVAGAIVWRKDPGSNLEVFERQGDMKNVLWVQISGHRYALSYNHQTQAIEVRQGTTRGQRLASFTNANTTGNVRTFFENL
jgi:hypothetical protein